MMPKMSKISSFETTSTTNILGDLNMDSSDEVIVSTPGVSESSFCKIESHKLIMVGTLFVINLLNYMDRNAIAGKNGHGF